jgi:hypothetical protein
MLTVLVPAAVPVTLTEQLAGDPPRRHVTEENVTVLGVLKVDQVKVSPMMLEVSPVTVPVQLVDGSGVLVRHEIVVVVGTGAAGYSPWVESGDESARTHA